MLNVSAESLGLGSEKESVVPACLYAVILNCQTAGMHFVREEQQQRKTLRLEFVLPGESPLQKLQTLSA